jgi:resuscitation-promoting factor RpfB
MRSHRLFGVGIAVLLGSSFLHQRPSSPDHHRHQSAGVHLGGTGVRLASTASPVADPYASPAPGEESSIDLLRPGATQHSLGAVQLASAVVPTDPTSTQGDATPVGVLRPAGTRYAKLLYAWESYLKAHEPPPPAPSATNPAVHGTPVVQVALHSATPTLTLPTPTPPATKAAGGSTSGGVWASLRQCESGGNYKDDTGNGYYGAYQFALGTWHGLGFAGLPSNASAAVQDEAAQKLQARSGWGQWPACSRKLRLI